MDAVALHGLMCLFCVCRSEVRVSLSQTRRIVYKRVFDLFIRKGVIELT